MSVWAELLRVYVDWSHGGVHSTPDPQCGAAVEAVTFQEQIDVTLGANGTRRKFRKTGVKLRSALNLVKSK